MQFTIHSAAIHACYGRYMRRVETEKLFARTRRKNETVEFFDSLVNNEATIKKKRN